MMKSWEKPTIQKLDIKLTFSPPDWTPPEHGIPPNTTGPGQACNTPPANPAGPIPAVCRKT